MNITTKTKSSFPFKAVILTAIVCFALSGGAAYLFGLFRQHRTAPEISGSLLGDKAEASLYTCGMHPWILSEEPGDCPICGMKLTPKRDEGGETGTVGGVEINIDPVTQQNMGIRTATAEKGPMIHTIRTYGHITYDETRTAEISPKYNGWFEKLYVDFTGQIVQKDQPLFEIYSPELLAAQEEYLIAYRAGKGGNDMLESARRRLSYFDVGEEEIRAIGASNTVKKTVTIRSPFTGVVTHKNAVKGGFVKAGTTIYKIADISRVWVEAHIYEYELGRISKGQNAEMTLPYLPGKVYSGKVAYIYPYLQQKTRDVVIRLEFENPNMELKPDMYADVRIETIAKGQGILIPSEAVIRSGERNVVFVTRDENKFAPREITLGMSADKGNIQVLAGLEPGETIVTSGQFLLDSESKLKEAVQKMMEAKKGGSEEDDFFDDMESEK
ncbi:MAG: efflux RND transporter periplasmic adaptor subunit [Desulfobacteraceae bacterium]|nr:efflux RND transporter periplasmic adaptor subunit [Desulfobacteraceae bacterium]